MIRRICVYCGSREGHDPAFRAAATDLGRLLAQRGLTLVYGGASVGLMGAVADAVLSGGGQAIGVLPDLLGEKEIAHPSLTELHRVDSMHTRKQMMADLADAFIALPGGIGTLEEVCEILTWAHIGLHRKPVGFLNIHDYYTPFLKFIDHAIDSGFIHPKHRARYGAASSAASLLDRFAQLPPPPDASATANQSEPSP